MVNNLVVDTKTPKATESNFSEVEDLATSAFFRVIGTIPSPSNASNTLYSGGMRFSGASMS